jgi:hypothetical protein
MKRLRGGLIGLALAALVAAPAAAHAAATCNGLLLIEYVSHVDNTVRVRVTLGTGDILGGTELTVEELQFELDCDSSFPLVPPCTDEGPVVEYEGDATITTTCPVTWSTGPHPVSTDPNVVLFTATPALEIPANQPTPPGMCSLEFDVKIVGPDTDGSGLIDELVGYQIAHCDNGILDSGGFQTADIITARQFGCYEVPRVKIPAPQPIVKLQDRFGTTTSKPVNFRELCAPADKNGEDPTAPDSPVHISAFDLTNTTGTISHPKGLSITTQFGTLKGDLGTPVFLFTPTSKSLTPPPPPPLAPDALRHFQCYRLGNVKGAPKTTGIHLSDQFTESFGGFTVDLDSSGPFRLCVPVNKNDEDPGALADMQALLCYMTRNDRLPFNQFTAFVTNQFGGFKVTGTQFDQLCEPTMLAPSAASARRVRIRRRR